VRAALTVLPFVPVFLLFSRRERSWRTGFVLAAAAWGTALVAVTEGLGWLGALTRDGATLAWLGLGALAWAVYARTPRPRPGVAEAARDWLRSVASADRVLLIASGLVVLLIGLVALLAAPNTYDSMTYHLSRVAHWARQGSVDHYPTHIVRQLTAPPLAEFAILQLQVLSGGDRLANLVQLFALCGCGLNVSLIAARLSAGVRTQVLAAVACLTLPMAILQGSSTQNDLLAAFWLSCFVGLVCDRGSPDRPGLSRADALALGAMLGLGLLTKGTVYLLCAGPVVLLAARTLRAGVASSAARLTLVAAVAALLNVGHLGRNVSTFGQSLSKQPGLRPLAEVITPSVIASNAIRGAAVHFDTPLDSVNRRLQTAVGAVDRALGVDVTDPRITHGAYYAAVKRLRLHEDFAGNPLHLLLALSAGCVLAIAGPAALRAYVAALALSTASLCIGLKWQMWISRLQLPLFVLACPLIAVAAGRLGPRAGRALGALLLVAALPWVVRNETRPLIGPSSVLVRPRSEQYFANLPSLLAPYRRAARAVAGAGCAEAGLIIGEGDFEYPLWVLMAEEAGKPVGLRHVQVGNASAAREGPLPPPCAVVAVGKEPIAAAAESMGRPPEWRDRPVAFWRGEPR
jgi:hypothetical protein